MTEENIDQANPENQPQTDERRDGSPDLSVPAGAPEGTPLHALEAALQEKEAALSEAQKNLDARSRDYDQLKATLDDAVKAYRKLAISTSPLYSEDVISGTSIQEINASIQKVNGLVKKMRTSLESELKSLIIPAGAPERSGPDLSGLSPRDKIKQGIQNK